MKRPEYLDASSSILAVPKILPGAWYVHSSCDSDVVKTLQQAGVDRDDVRDNKRGIILYSTT